MISKNNQYLKKFHDENIHFLLYNVNGKLGNAFPCRCWHQCWNSLCAEYSRDVGPCNLTTCLRLDMLHSGKELLP